VLDVAQELPALGVLAVGGGDNLASTGALDSGEEYPAPSWRMHRSAPT
jgi:hypothetical protein